MGAYNVANVLDLIAQYETTGEPGYMVKERPLNSLGGTAARKASPFLRHEHFVHKDGVKNFGFGANGVFAEKPEDLKKYRFTKEYGMKTYDAGLLEMLLNEWNEKNDAIEQVAEDLDLQEEVPPSLYRDYSLGLNDCQSFIRDFDYRYNMKKSGH